ncbi:MAG TPA: hypothetical protein VN240_02145 [Propylenella sp.]|nr:hypothetical protein [Propylenella sp.]
MAASDHKEKAAERERLAALLSDLLHSDNADVVDVSLTSAGDGTRLSLHVPKGAGLNASVGALAAFVSGYVA